MEANNEDLEAVRFNWARSPLYRAVHVGGAWATVTPQLELQVVFFNDLEQLPDTALFRLEPDGALGESLDNGNVKKVVREAEAAVVMHIETAKRVIDLLTMMIEQAEGRISKRIKASRLEEG